MSALIKKGIFAVSLIVIGMGLMASPVQAQLGAAAGYGLNMINQPSFSSSASNSFESTGGMSAGIFYNFPFGRVALRPGVFVQQSSFEWHVAETMFSPLESSMRTASIPVDLRYRFPMEQFSPYVVAGPGFNFLHTAQTDLRQALDNPKGTTYFTSVNLGAGIELPFEGLGLVLLPEVRYSHALSGFMEEEYIVRTVPYSSDGSRRISNLTFRLGIQFLSIGQ